MADDAGHFGHPQFHADFDGGGDAGQEWLTEYQTEDDYAELTEEEMEELYGGMGDGGEAGMGPDTLEQILEDCVKPVVAQGMAHVGKLLFWCLVFRFTTQAFHCPRWLSHLISAATGVVALAHFFQYGVAFFLVLSVVSYLTLRVADTMAKGFVGPIATAACITFNVACELFVAAPKDWHQVRGAQMILSMKIISIAWDLDEGFQLASKDKKGVLSKPPSLLEFLGYALCPGNCIFGPWVKFSEYQQMLEAPVWNFTWFVKILFSLAYGFMFLTISTCFNPYFIHDDVWIFWRAYRDAMSFRASHYFVSYVSEATSAAAGLGATGREGRHDWSGVQVALPFEIEMPRSLREVAKAWNRPMHLWLKDYCFKRVLPCGPGVAFLTTYLASVMLHGLNFQLGAVLLSLGLFAFAEHELRSRLSTMFNASLGTAKSDDARRKEWEIPVAAFNLAAGMLVVFNLAYLGVMFNQDQSMVEGYSWEHTLKKWQELGFSAHLVMGFVFILAKVV